MTSGPGAPLPEDSSTPSRIARRGFVLGGAVLLGAGAVGAMQWFNVGAKVSEDALSVRDAHQAALSGKITLIDIRRPDEWARTGVGEGAIPIDMRREDFTAELQAVTAGKETPIALICARGVRSARLTARLTKAGYAQIVDVPEGMLGSGAGPGWLKTGLPVVTVD